MAELATVVLKFKAEEERRLYSSLKVKTKWAYMIGLEEESDFQA